jgi:hypothetical protein
LNKGLRRETTAAQMLKSLSNLLLATYKHAKSEILQPREEELRANSPCKLTFESAGGQSFHKGSALNYREQPDAHFQDQTRRAAI